MEKIEFFDVETGEMILFELIDQLQVDGEQYLLVADEEDYGAILKLNKDTESEVSYELIEDESEFQKITLLFMENDDYDIEV